MAVSLKGLRGSDHFCLFQSPSVLDGICMEDVDCSVGNPVVHGNGTACFA